MTTLTQERVKDKAASLYATRRQRTLARPVEIAGIGLHTGKLVKLRLSCAPANTGLVFKRSDQPLLPPLRACYRSVYATTERCTTLGQGAHSIFTVEHLLAALYSQKIDNALIELDNIEPPIGNGASDHFIELLDLAGSQEQDADRLCLRVESPLSYSLGHIHLVALPCPNYRISYTLSYPRIPLLRAQYHTVEVTPASFIDELASCRTFCLYQEITALIEKGLIKGGSLDNAVIIDGQTAYSKGGLYFDNEMARHKILDIIGDLALYEVDIEAHIIAICSGHATNFAFGKLLLEEANEIG